MGMHNKVKIGVSFRREFPPEDVLHSAQEVEALGYDTLWLVEDCFYASGIASAAATLASTERIKVGVGIMPAVARNPVFTAMEIATIGRMYPERFIAGIGHGVARWMRQIGAFPNSQMIALREGVEISRALLDGAVVHYDGRQFQIDAGELAYPPAIIPPIYLGVRGPKSLELSGKIANGTILAEYSSPEYVKWAKDQIQQGKKDNTKHSIVVFVYAYAGETREAEREKFRPMIAKAMLSQRKDIYFTTTGYAELLREVQAIDDLHAASQLVPDVLVDQMGIFGTRTDWNRAIDDFAAAGADEIVLVPMPKLGIAQAAVFADFLEK